MNDFTKYVLKLAYETKPVTAYWNTLGLSGDDHTFKRSKPAPFLNFLFRINQYFPFKNIVEIGSCRFGVTQKCIDYFSQENHPLESPACCADGHSTYFLSKLGGDFYTVDIDNSRIDSIKSCYNNLNEPLPDNLFINIPYDGVEFLTKFSKQIDLLFLDGWDVGSPKYAENHLLAYKACKDKLSEKCIIVIDDTDFTCPEGGKDRLLGPALIEDGYVPFLKGRQTLFIKV